MPVTTDGEIYIAEKLAGEATTITIDALSVYTNVHSPVVGDVYGTFVVPANGEASPFRSGYPQTDDSDVNNPGTTDTNVVTYSGTLGTGLVATLKGTILNDATATTGSNDELLASANFAADVPKDATQILVVYVNISIDSA